MYNPQNLHECEKEKGRAPKRTRKLVDGLMTVIGGVASVSSIPQVLKIWETKAAGDLSLTAYLISFAAVISWFLYGLYIKNKPLAITSGLSVLVLGIVVIQILIYS
ncbi:MAG: SemiSWEET family transporter [Candidatus Paceibacterota bacterium]